MPVHRVICAGLILALVSRTIVAIPTLQDFKSDVITVDKRDEYFHGSRIAGDDEDPPPGVKLPARGVEMSNIQPRQGAPASISSSDGNFLLGESPCDQDTAIAKYFLFGSDVQDNANVICQAALAWADPKGVAVNLQPTTVPPFTGSKVIKARVKVAATIWHRGSVRVDIQVTNYGMESNVDTKKTAQKLCEDTVNYFGNTCLNGIGGTSGAGAHPQFFHEALRDGTVVWNDKSGKKMIGFAFTQKPN